MAGWLWGDETDGEHFIVTAGKEVKKLGFQVAGIPPDQVLVHEARPGSWAEEAGLKAGDEFISINNVALSSCGPDEFKKLMRARPLNIAVNRPGVGERSGAGPKGFGESGPDDAVSTLQDHVPFYAEAEHKVLKLGLRPSLPPGRVLVEKVTPNSWAEEKEIKVGDEIVTINGAMAKTMEEREFLQVMKHRPLCLMVQPPLDTEPRLFEMSLPPLDAEVRVAGMRGFVRYAGPFQNEHMGQGCIVGVELLHPLGDSDGMLGETRYFQCAPQHGIFVDPIRVQVLELPQNLFGASGRKAALPKMGAKVVARIGDRQHQGRVRYTGNCHFTSGPVVGVELYTTDGNTDGTVDGFKYFECEAYRGIFCRPENIQLVAGHVTQVHEWREAEGAVLEAIFHQDTEKLPELLETAKQAGVNRKVLERGRRVLERADGERILDLVGLGVSNDVLSESLGYHVRCELADDLDEVPNPGYLQRLEELAFAHHAAAAPDTV